MHNTIFSPPNDQFESVPEQWSQNPETEFCKTVSPKKAELPENSQTREDSNSQKQEEQIASCPPASPHL